MITDELNISIIKTQNSRISELSLGLEKFGRVFADHMFVADYKNGEWKNLNIQPYDKISLSPSTSALHYGQAIFEGMKAYKNRKTKEILVFRPEENMNRLNKSAQRMCMPEMPLEIFKEGLYQLLRLDSAWVPGIDNSALYIRPFMFATDEYIGVKASSNYKFMIFCAPVGMYYSKPVNVKIETHYSRSAPGGTGAAKAAGNYAASIYPAKLGQDQGFDQLVWTDAISHKYIEESGTMNIMFVINNKLVTPPTSETILNGITRDSVLTVARDWKIEVEERPISVDEIIEVHTAGQLTEMFGTGTAATIAQIASFTYNNKKYELPPVENRFFSNKVSSYLTELKVGREEDKFGWVTKL